MTEDTRRVRVVLDPSLCQGHGECVRIAPNLFSLDATLTSHCDEWHPLTHRAALEHAEDSCPARALFVEVVEG